MKRDSLPFCWKKPMHLALSKAFNDLKKDIPLCFGCSCPLRQLQQDFASEISSSSGRKTVHQSPVRPKAWHKLGVTVENPLSLFAEATRFPKLCYRVFPLVHLFIEKLRSDTCPLGSEGKIPILSLHRLSKDVYFNMRHYSCIGGKIDKEKDVEIKIKRSKLLVFEAAKCKITIMEIAEFNKCQKYCKTAVQIAISQNNKCRTNIWTPYFGDYGNKVKV